MAAFLTRSCPLRVLPDSIRMSDQQFCRLQLVGHIDDPLDTPNRVSQHKSPGLDAIDVGGPRFHYLVGDKRSAQYPEFAVEQDSGEVVKGPVWQAADEAQLTRPRRGFKLAAFDLIPRPRPPTNSR
jgi:hypothetical protein